MVMAFMKNLKKIFQMAVVRYKDPYLKINKYLKVHRSTPHPITKKLPAELLVNRKFVTRLPDLRTNPAKGRKKIEEVREEDAKAKEKMKAYKDKGREVKDHKIKVSDKAILMGRLLNTPRPMTLTHTPSRERTEPRSGARGTANSR